MVSYVGYYYVNLLLDQTKAYNLTMENVLQMSSSNTATHQQTHMLFCSICIHSVRTSENGSPSIPSLLLLLVRSNPFSQASISLLDCKPCTDFIKQLWFPEHFSSTSQDSPQQCLSRLSSISIYICNPDYCCGCCCGSCCCSCCCCCCCCCCLFLFFIDSTTYPIEVVAEADSGL